MANTVYWTDFDRPAGTMWKGSLSDTTITTTAQITNAGGSDDFNGIRDLYVAAGGKIYWTRTPNPSTNNAVGYMYFGTPTGTNTITGTPITLSTGSDFIQPDGVFLDSGFIYWAQRQTATTTSIKVGTLVGSVIYSDHFVATNSDYPEIANISSLYVNGTTIYWTNVNSSKAYSATLTAAGGTIVPGLISDVTPLSGFLSGPDGLFILDTTAYTSSTGDKKFKKASSLAPQFGTPVSLTISGDPELNDPQRLFVLPPSRVGSGFGADHMETFSGC